MSKAVVFYQYGSADVLQIAEVTAKKTEAGQALIRVKAAGVQPFDCLFRSGAMKQWLPAKFPQQLGNEFAGTIEALGEGVSAFSIGDEVLGWSMQNAYAEHLCVSVEQIVYKPKEMSWAEAGVLSASGQTASTAISLLGVNAGDKVLIHAAAGGVGSFAVQLAKARGATVIGTASERNHAYLRSLGATPVLYGDGLTERVREVSPGGVDASLIAVGSVEAMQSSIALTQDKTRIGTVAFHPMSDKLGIKRLSSERSLQRLASLVALYQEGGLKIFIEREYPLTEAAAAHQAVESGHVRGKVALVM